MSQLTHKFEKGVLRTDKSAFNGVDTYSIQFSCVSDDALYDLYSSFIELTVETDISSTAELPSKIELNPILQPAGMVNKARVEYQYLNTSNEPTTVSLSEDSNYIPHCRAICDLMLDSKAQHEQYAGLTEWAYNTQHDSNVKQLWSDRVEVKQSGIATDKKSAHGSYKIRLPYRDIMLGANGPSFVNLKSLKLEITWVEPYEFFATAANDTTAFITGSASTSVTCKNWQITRCEYINSVYLGNVTEIDPSLRGLQSTVVRHTIQKFKQGEKEWCSSVTIPFKTSYLIVYMTDKNGNHRNLQKRHIKEITCKLLASPEAYKTVSDVSTDELDLYWYYILSHCVAEGRDYEPIINYRNWQDRFYFTILPLNEMYAQKADNLWNIQFSTHEPAADGDQLHLLWIKEGQEITN